MIFDYKKNILEKYGPTALVTGATDGIGKDFSIELAKKGFHLILVSRNEKNLKDLSLQLQKDFNILSEYVTLDLSSESAPKELMEIISKKDIGLAVLAAGFGTSGEFSDLDIQKELEMIDLNCKSVVESTYYFTNQFKKRKNGGIILFSSLVAFQGVARSTTYSATKAFIQNFAEGLHTELKGYNIDILAVAPGPVRSGFAERANMNMGFSQNPKGIANECLKALGKVSTIRPGFLSKLLGYSLSSLPRNGRRIILNKIMEQMTNKSNE